MIWDIIKKVILFGMISWIIFLILTIYQCFKFVKNQRKIILSKIFDKEETKRAYEYEWSRLQKCIIIFSFSIFIILTFVIIFF